MYNSLEPTSVLLFSKLLSNIHEGEPEEIETPAALIVQGSFFSFTDTPDLVQRGCLDEDLVTGGEELLPEILVLAKLEHIAADDNL